MFCFLLYACICGTVISPLHIRIWQVPNSPTKLFLRKLHLWLYMKPLLRYIACMIKKKDIVVDSKGQILQVEGFHKDGAETFVLGRVYRSQKRVAVPVSSVRKHPLFT